jgi:hypothetical protein
MSRTLTENRPVLRFIVERMRRRSSRIDADRHLLTMVHAWVWLDNPAGMFAQHHTSLPYLRAGLSVPDSPSVEAATGIGLLAPGGCPQEIRRIAFVARTSVEQEAALHDACRAAANRVTSARAREGTALDAEAEAAWKEFAATQNQVLSMGQKRRLKSMVEHPEGMDHGGNR